MSKKCYDFAIIGGGALGMNIARRLLTNFKGSKIVLLDSNYENYENPSYELIGGLNFYKNNLKSELLKNSHELIKGFCSENYIKYIKQDQFIVSKTPADEEIINKNKLQKATFEEVTDPILLDTAKSRQFYINEKAALVDSNQIKTYLFNSIKCEDLDYKKKTNIEKIIKNGSTYKITTNKRAEIDSKYIINVSGLEALSLAKQTGDYKYNQFNYTYTYYKLPNQLNFNKIYSSPPYLIHPGITMYKDYDEYPVLGPVINLSVQQNSFIGKIRNLIDYYRFLPILVNNDNYEMNITYNHPYKAKMIFQPFMNIYYVIGTEKVFKKDIRSVLLENKKIVEDIVVIKGDNAIHLLNNNMIDNEVSLFLPLTEYIIKNII